MTGRAYELTERIMQRTYTKELVNEYLKSIDSSDSAVLDCRFITEKIHPAELSNRRLTCIRSPMGSGKSELVDAFLHLDKPNSCLLLSARKTYSFAMQKRLERHSFKRADDPEHVATALSIDTEYIICQIDSIGRCLIEQSVEVLILDEAMSLLQ